MKYASLFPDFADDTRLWVHIAERSLMEDEQRVLLERVRSFIDQWTSHGHPVTGAVKLLEDRILLLAATLEGDGRTISGCGIDAATHTIEEAAQSLGVEWASPLAVFYRDRDGQLRSCSRSAFRDRIQAEELTTETHVLDPSITTVGALRAGAMDTPAEATWHGRVFDLPQPA